MACIRLKRTIKSDRTTLFTALTGQEQLAAWFAPNIITTPVAGTYAAFAFEEEIHFKVLLKEIVENTKVVWEYVEGNLDWDWSKIIFQLKAIEPEKTLLTFSHSGLPDTEKLEKWKNSWRNFLNNLKNFTEKK